MRLARGAVCATAADVAAIAAAIAAATGVRVAMIVRVRADGKQSSADERWSTRLSSCGAMQRMRRSFSLCGAHQTSRGMTKMSTIIEIIVNPWSATGAHTLRVFSARYPPAIPIGSPIAAIIARSAMPTGATAKWFSA